MKVHLTFDVDTDSYEAACSKMRQFMATARAYLKWYGIKADFLKSHDLPTPKEESSKEIEIRLGGFIVIKDDPHRIYISANRERNLQVEAVDTEGRSLNTWDSSGTDETIKTITFQR